VLSPYSGRWKPYPIVYDRKWLGGLAHGDVDPRIAGRELYAGGKRGNLYQVVAYPQHALDCRLIAHLPGREIHTILAGELDPASDGPELLVFTRPGGLFRVTPTGADGKFETEHVAELSGRIRDAVVLPRSSEGTPRIATVSRTGRLELLTMTVTGPVWRLVYADAMGMGRVTAQPARVGQPLVLYATHDDGRILRHEEQAGGSWRTETIFCGPLGPRGIAAGQFHSDPDVETVAFFGYSRKVQLLSRVAGGKWTVETLFQDRHKGHWLAVAELDGRNGTLELLSSGYSGRIVMLSRPPGYGRDVLAE